MATTATNNSREARRRRILERGSDRLALITGRIETLPSDADQSPSTTSQIPADSSQIEDIASSPSLPKDESAEEEPRQQIISNATVEPLSETHEKLKNIASRAAALLGVEQELAQVSSSIQQRLMHEPQRRVVLEPQPERQTHRNSLEPHREQQTQRNSLTTGEICSAVSASENTRMCCSVAAAVLVILSYVGFPILGWSGFKSVLLFRPLYLLLLTNISIVVARLVLRTQGAGRAKKMSSVPGNDLFSQMGKALELGLMLQKVFGALFMDVSIYSVVLVCGLSLVQILGW